MAYFIVSENFGTSFFYREKGIYFENYTLGQLGYCFFKLRNPSFKSGAKKAN